MKDRLKPALIGAVVVMAGIMCCGGYMYQTPGPWIGACMLDRDTLRFNMLMEVSGVPIPTHSTRDVGQPGAPFQVFVSAEPTGGSGGLYHATFRNTWTGEEITQTIPRCERRPE